MIRRSLATLLLALTLLVVAACSSDKVSNPAPQDPAPVAQSQAPTQSQPAVVPTPPPPPPVTAPTPPPPPAPSNAATPTTTPAPTVPAQPQPVPYTVDKSKLSKTLNLFSWSEYLPEEVLKDFEAEFGVRVNYDAYASNEEMAAKLQAGGGTYDLVVPSTYMIQSLIKQGLLQRIDLTQVPNFKHIVSGFTNLTHDPGNQYSIPYMWGTVGIAYNSKLVSTPPSKWEDLLNPTYKNRIVALDDSREIMTIGLQASGFSRNETAPAKVKTAQDWLRKLLPNIKAWDSDSPKGLLISGEAWLGVVWNGEAALAMTENPNIKYVMPKDGGGLWLDSVVIPKGAPHAYTAHVFLNYLLQPKVAAKIGTAYPYGLPNADGYKLLPAAVKSNVASYPPQEWLTKAEYAGDLGEAASLFDRTFTELKSSQ